MTTTHIVKQGEYVSLLADKYGFRDFKAIWEDPANADLKKKRVNPSVLFPGDKVVIPERLPREEVCSTEAKHRFRAKALPLKLRLVFKDSSANPIANAKCHLDIGSAPAKLSTDDNGKVESVIPNSATTCRLELQTDAILDTNFEIAIGELDPLDTVTGQIARLNNLGYDAGEVKQPVEDEAKRQFSSAVEEFQCNNDVTPIDGICGPKTQAKLKQLHGC